MYGHMLTLNVNLALFLGYFDHGYFRSVRPFRRHGFRILRTTKLQRNGICLPQSHLVNGGDAARVGAVSIRSDIELVFYKIKCEG